MATYISERPVKTERSDRVIRMFQNTFPIGKIEVVQPAHNPPEVSQAKSAYFAIEIPILEEERLAVWLNRLNGRQMKKQKK